MKKYSKLRVFIQTFTFQLLFYWVSFVPLEFLVKLARHLVDRKPFAFYSDQDLN